MYNNNNSTPSSSSSSSEAGDSVRSSVFNPGEPLRQPRTSPPVAESSTESQGFPTFFNSGYQNSSATALKTSDSLVKNSKLSAAAPEFVPSSYASYQDDVYSDGSEGYYAEASLADLVQDFVSHLTTSPGSFEVEIDYITDTLNSWVTTEETLQELVELIYTQSTSVPNFSYTGARLCNHLSHCISLSPSSGNFRQLLLQRCRTEYEQRDQAVKGDETTQKKYHSYVLFLGELYLNLEIILFHLTGLKPLFTASDKQQMTLEVKSGKGTPGRADVLLGALKDLLNALFSHPDDPNLICAVKLLKLSGSILEDTWKEKGKSDMDEIIKKIEEILLDARCSRDVRQMLLKLVELRSSNWGRVYTAAVSSDATPDNDPNYFMNEPTFYTADGTPFTAADPEYSEKYQEILDREDYFPDTYEENGNESFCGEDDEMDPEIEEAFERFCMESETRGK
ncbi:polyadenylate-binding protein-interacting protein 1-like isoform X2 [Myxocyprinus asiaticus]|uniref:polyadenylate-binding protein-interacting protein 1-like isoform X2 n=1 Tax=Myxocyprinus asiaticus TaxID=70543 RepID=UPI002221E907|nr:polyadenylate-binding protein-interacting protein 1-like isoform X2 [Myxocyprinus asiaticus]